MQDLQETQHADPSQLDGIVAEAEGHLNQNLRSVRQDMKWQKQYERSTRLAVDVHDNSHNHYNPGHNDMYTL
jgi:hypothetical protein